MMMMMMMMIINAATFNSFCHMPAAAAGI